jgi:hypothetical protein
VLIRRPNLSSGNASFERALRRTAMHRCGDATPPAALAMK